jgi:hypothetical protein
MKTVLLDGSTWPLLPLDDQNQFLGINDALAFGNHKGADQQPELLLKLVRDDVNRGFALPLPLNKIKTIPGILLAPLNIQLQKTINKQGKIIPKNQMTHNQSWKWQSETSVNSRVDEKQLMPCYFGRALKRLINWTVAVGLKDTQKREYLPPSWTSRQHSKGATSTCSDYHSAVPLAPWNGAQFWNQYVI